MSFKIFPEHEVVHFSKVPSCSRVFLPPVEKEDILVALLEVKFLEHQSEDGSSRIIDRSVISPGVIQFVNDSKVHVSMLKFRLKQYCTAWFVSLVVFLCYEVLANERKQRIDRTDPKQPVFVIHAFDESGKCHCVSNYVRLALILLPFSPFPFFFSLLFFFFFFSSSSRFFQKVSVEPDKISIRVTYDELTSSPAVAVKLGATKIKKTHEQILYRLAESVLSQARPALRVSRGSDAVASVSPPESEYDSLVLPERLNASSNLGLSTAKAVKVSASGTSTTASSDLQSSLKSIRLYDSQSRPTKHKQKYLNGTILMALNADNDEWEEARVLSFEEDLYEVWSQIFFFYLFIFR